jgi:H+/Cl- antiporter ClcA
MFSFRFKQQIALPQASFQLCLLGIVGGIIAAGLIILLRLTLDLIQHWVLSGQLSFTTINPWLRIALPILAALAIIGFAKITAFHHHRMGIPFVIHRLRNHYGHIPLKNTANQFVGSILAISSGFSVGREGPAVHIGAAGSSFIGQWFKLPYNSIRILSGCGMAAGISASFNTPLAAVIFVMEVVMKEYKIAIFIPIMLAAACGSLLTNLVFGESIELDFLNFSTFNYESYPYFILFGIVLGMLAKVFNQALLLIMQTFSSLDMTKRLLLAAAVTSVIGIILPQGMGSELSFMQGILEGQHSQLMILSILVAKLVLTWFALGLGIPGGIIGPIFSIGILAGAIFAGPLGLIITDTEGLDTSYALLGMAGLLSATVHAPLSALTAVMELSYQPEIILPAMLVIVSAYITSVQFFRNKSTFTLQLHAQGLDFKQSSIAQELQKMGVLGIVNSHCQLVTDQTNEQLRQNLQSNPQQDYIVNTRFYAIDATYTLAQRRASGADIQIFSMQGVGSQATLAEVYAQLSPNRSGAVYIYDDASQKFIGIVTWQQIQDILHKDNF